MMIQMIQMNRILSPEKTFFRMENMDLPKIIMDLHQIREMVFVMLSYCMKIASFRINKLFEAYIQLTYLVLKLIS